MQDHFYYANYALQFADMQIPELVNEFNAQVQSRAWSSMRAYHDQALIDEFQNRGIDVSAVSDGKAISFAKLTRYDERTRSLSVYILHDQRAGYDLGHQNLAEKSIQIR